MGLVEGGEPLGEGQHELLELVVDLDALSHAPHQALAGLPQAQAPPLQPLGHRLPHTVSLVCTVAFG